MTLKDHLIKLLEADAWATQVLAETIEKTNAPDDRSLLLFSHLLSSYSMWLSRVRGKEITTALFQERTLQESKRLMQEIFPELLSYLRAADEPEINRIIQFTFPLDGSQRQLSVADAITHLVTHSTYHRGQIMVRLKEKVDNLPLTTYIAYALAKGY
jgi:uncharacterized damage-inducible protein DinB